jgi:hypothetical protein
MGMKPLCSFVFLLLIVHVVEAQSPITIPYPEDQFYKVPVSIATIDQELDSIYVYHYDSSTKTWNKSDRYTFHYDANGLLEQAIKWNWRWDALYWKGETKKDYQYADFRLTKSTEYMWWNDSANWVKRYINNYEYGKTYIQENSFYHYISPPSDSKYQKRLLYYDSDWKMTLERIFDYIAFDDTYSEYNKYNYTYDDINRMIEYIDSRCYLYWEVQSKDVYTYNDDSCTVLDVSYSLQSDVLKEYSRTVDQFIFKDGQLARIIRYPESSKLTPGSQPTYVMDTYDFRYENGKLKERINSIGTAYLDEKTEYFYSKKNTTALHQQTEAYPNPCLNELTIQHQGIKSIQLYTMNGLLVQTENCNSSLESQIINISKLQNGMYMVKICKIDGLSLLTRIIKR